MNNSKDEYPDWIGEIGTADQYEELPDIGSQQDEFEWREKRLGMITGSNFGKLVKTDKSGFKLSTSKTASDLMYKIAWERLLKGGNISNGLGRLNISSQSINHGNDYEGEAMLKYQEVTGRKVDYTQNFIAKGDWVGGTPDGYVGKDGLIEVKCPFNGGNHLKAFLDGEIYNQEYVYQMQGYMWITGRKWCDFVTYDPDLIDGLQLSVIRVERDENVINGIAMVMEEVKNKIQSIINNPKLKVD